MNGNSKAKLQLIYLLPVYLPCMLKSFEIVPKYIAMIATYHHHQI